MWSAVRVAPAVSFVRIAQVSTSFVPVPPRAYGGTELVVHALSRALVRAGHEVVVFTTGDSRVPGRRAFFEEAIWPPDPGRPTSPTSSRSGARAGRRGARTSTLRLVRGPKGAFAEVVDVQGGPLAVRIEV